MTEKENKASLVLKVVGDRARDDAAAAKREAAASGPVAPGPLPPSLEPLPPTPPVLQPLVAERMEDFASNSAPGDQVHLPGGRIIRTRKGFVSERHGGDRAEHASPFDAAQHLATVLALEPHVRRVEHHARQEAARAEHHVALTKHAEDHAKKHRAEESLDEAGLRMMDMPGLTMPSAEENGRRATERALRGMASAKWLEAQHPRQRGGKFASKAALRAALDAPDFDMVTHGPVSIHHQGGGAYRVEAGGESVVAGHSKEAADEAFRLARKHGLREGLFNEVEHPRGRGGTFVEKVHAAIEKGDVAAKGAFGPRTKSSFGGNLHRIQLHGEGATDYSFDRRTDGSWHHTFTSTYGNTGFESIGKLSPKHSKRLDELDAAAAKQDLAAMKKSVGPDEPGRYNLAKARYEALKAHVEGGYFTGPSAHKIKESAELEEFAVPHIGTPVRFHFDPRLHERDRLGKFTDMLSKLQRSPHGSTLHLPHGVAVERDVRGLTVTGNGPDKRLDTVHGVAGEALFRHVQQEVGRGADFHAESRTLLGELGQARTGAVRENDLTDADHLEARQRELRLERGRRQAPLSAPMAERRPRLKTTPEGIARIAAGFEAARTLRKSKGRQNMAVGEPVMPGELRSGDEFITRADERFQVRDATAGRRGKVKLHLDRIARDASKTPAGKVSYRPGEDQGFRRPPGRANEGLADMGKPLTDKHLMDLVKAGATVEASQWAAGKQGGLAAMMEKGFVFHAGYLNGLPKSTSRHMGFKVGGRANEPLDSPYDEREGRRKLRKMSDAEVVAEVERVIPQGHGAVHDQSVPGEYRRDLAAEANRRAQRRYQGEGDGTYTPPSGRKNG